MSAETAEQVVRLLEEIKPLVAKLVPLLRELEGRNDEVATDRLEISVRAYNRLKEAGAKTVGDVRAMSDGDLLHIPGLGRKSLAEIKQAIKQRAWCEP